MTKQLNNKYGLLLTNTVIFAIGNLLVKLISFFLMPLYTSILTAEQYGVSELLNSTVELLLPLFSLCIVEALYRFSIDKYENRASLFTNAITILFCGDLIIVLLSVLFNVVFQYAYAFELCLLYITNSFYKLTTQFARGLGHSKRFALYGIINALLLVISNIILLVVYKGGVKEYLLSFCIGYGFSGCIAFIASKEYFYLRPNSFDKKKLKDMLRYGVPDILNTFSWWVNSVSDRYIILYFCGAGVAGIYTAASKLPAMINLAASIFQQAWQYSAAKEIENKGNAVFFTKVFRFYTLLCVILCTVLVFINRFICGVLLKADFFEAWRFVPILLLAATFGCFSSYLGSFYGAIKNNFAAMISTTVGAISNLVLNIILIPDFGGFGAAIATAFSYMLIATIRFIDLKKRIQIEFEYNRTIIQLLILSVFVILSVSEYFTLTYFVGLLFVLLIILTDIEIVKQAFIYFLKHFNQK